MQPEKKTVPTSTIYSKGIIGFTIITVIMILCYFILGSTLPPIKDIPDMPIRQIYSIIAVVSLYISLSMYFTRTIIVKEKLSIDIKETLAIVIKSLLLPLIRYITAYALLYVLRGELELSRTISKMFTADIRQGFISIVTIIFSIVRVFISIFVMFLCIIGTLYISISYLIPTSKTIKDTCVFLRKSKRPIISTILNSMLSSILKGRLRYIFAPIILIIIFSIISYTMNIDYGTIITYFESGIGEFLSIIIVFAIVNYYISRFLISTTKVLIEYDREK